MHDCIFSCNAIYVWNRTRPSLSLIYEICAVPFVYFGTFHSIVIICNYELLPFIHFKGNTVAGTLHRTSLPTSHTQTHTHTLSLSLSLCLCLSPSLSLSLSLSYTHQSLTHYLSLSISHTLSFYLFAFLSPLTQFPQ